jgi:hypothetical protein
MTYFRVSFLIGQYLWLYIPYPDFAHSVIPFALTVAVFPSAGQQDAGTLHQNLREGYE